MSRYEYDGDPRSLGRDVNPLPWIILRLLAFVYVVGTTVGIIAGWIR